MKRYKAIAIVPLTITSDSKLTDEDQNIVFSSVIEQLNMSTFTISDHNVLGIDQKGDITLIYL